MKFFNLHVHSEYSILDGCGKQSDFIQRALEMKQEALAFTDHGTLRGIYNFHKLAKEIKPIYGIEFYLARDHRIKGLPQEEIDEIEAENKGKLVTKRAIREREVELGIRKNNHLTVIAKNNQGLKNLYRLSSIGWLQGFYYRPRIDFDLLLKYGDGLIILSGCLAGKLSQLILEDRFNEALELVEIYQDKWGDDFYLEIMPNSIPDQTRVNRSLVRISNLLNISLVATIDSHYPRRTDWKAHDLLLCINTKKKMNDPERWRFSAQDFWLYSKKEVLAQFRKNHPFILRDQVIQAIESTEKIVGKCEISLDVETGVLYIPDPLDTINDFQELVTLTWEGWDQREIPNNNIYLDRLKKELSQIKRQGVAKYFLVVWDLCNWARSKKITMGPGRGSAGGCLVAYLLQITDIDPVAHGLLFERFLSPDRIDIPDIDLDFEDARRGEIIGYLKSKYGDDCVCQISTVAAMKGKLCLRDIGRALDISYPEIDQIANSITFKEEARDQPVLVESFNSIPVCQRFNKKHPEVLDYARILEGQARNLGLHAAGVLVSSKPLQEIIPLETRDHKKERVVCSGWDMKGCEAAGLLKIDILGLRTMTIISDCLKAIAIEEEIDLNQIDIQDKKVFLEFTQGHFLGIFQFDADSARAICKGVDFESFQDVVVMVALDRPGTTRSGLAKQFLQRKADPSKRESIHPIVDEICKETYGILVFQEQISKLFIELAGYSPGEADQVRKAVGKKLGLGDHKKRFVEGATKRGMKKKDAEKLATQITHFGAYGFNKSHSTAYALIAYRMMWLKKYYPVQFLWALMKNEPDRHQLRKFLGEARRLGIKVLPPQVGISGIDFLIDGDSIRCGLSDLRGVGPAAVKSIVDDGPYKDFPNFVENTNTRSVNRRVVEVLAKSGSLKHFIPNLKWFLDNLSLVWENRTKKDFKIWWEEKIEEKHLADYSSQEKAIIASEVSPYGSGDHPIEAYRVDLDQWKIDWCDLGNDVWNHKWVWIRGIVTSSQYHRVGDWGESLTEDEKIKRGFGKQFAKINVEGLDGNQKIKVNWDRINPDIRGIIDQGAGTSVIALLAVNKAYNSLQVRALWNLQDTWKRSREGNLTSFERTIIEERGLLDGYKARDISLQRKKKEINGIGVVISIIERIDKNLNSFARIGLWGRKGFLEAVCFSEYWDVLKENVKEKQLVEVILLSSGMGWIIKKLKILK